MKLESKQIVMIFDNWVIEIHFDRSGGLPNADLMTAGRYLSNFKGCIHKLQIQDSGVLNFNRAAVSAVNVVPCSR